MRKLPDKFVAKGQLLKVRHAMVIAESVRYMLSFSAEWTLVHTFQCACVLPVFELLVLLVDF